MSNQTEKAAPLQKKAPKLQDNHATNTKDNQAKTGFLMFCMENCERNDDTGFICRTVLDGISDAVNLIVTINRTSIDSELEAFHLAWLQWHRSVNANGYCHE